MYDSDILVVVIGQFDVLYCSATNGFYNLVTLKVLEARTAHPS